MLHFDRRGVSRFRSRRGDVGRGKGVEGRELAGEGVGARKRRWAVQQCRCFFSPPSPRRVGDAVGAAQGHVRPSWMSAVGVAVVRAVVFLRVRGQSGARACG